MGSSTSKDEENVQVTDVLKQVTYEVLQQKTVDSRFFLCKKCSNFLTPPVAFIPLMGNICGNCNDSNTLLNPSMDLLLKNLIIPCAFILNGCTEKMNFDDLGVHQNLCLFRNYPCPLPNTTCTWKGPSGSLLEHFEQQHKQKIIRSTDNQIIVTADIKRAGNIWKLLLLKNEKFILHVKCEPETSYIFYRVFYIGSKEKSQNFLFALVQAGTDDAYLKHELTSEILHDVLLSKPITETPSLKINLTLLKQHTTTSDIKNTIKIIPKINENNDKFLKYLECAVCFHFQRPPIYVCNTGHSICHRCHQKLEKCPTCNEKFSRSRNFSLESLAEKTCYPCLNHESGCDVRLVLHEIDNHEKNCLFRKVLCPFNETEECQWEEALNMLPAHLKVIHPENTSTDAFYESTVYFRDAGNFIKMFFMLIYNEIFQVYCKKIEGNIFWSVRIFGKRNEAKEYMFEIGISGENKEMSLRHACYESANMENIPVNSLAIPVEFIKWFIDERMAKCYCKISKISVK